MSIETIVLAATKAMEELTATLKQLVPALGATALGSPAAPADTDAKAAVKAAKAAAKAAETAKSPTPASTMDLETFGKVFQDLAKSHGRDAAVAAIEKFGGIGRASTIKEIDWPAAYAYALAEHARLDGVKDAAAAAAAAAAASGSDLI